MEIMQVAVRGSALGCNGVCSEHAEASMMCARRACMGGEARAEEGEPARSRAFTMFSDTLERAFF